MVWIPSCRHGLNAIRHGFSSRLDDLRIFEVADTTETSIFVTFSLGHSWRMIFLRAWRGSRQEPTKEEKKKEAERRGWNRKPRVGDEVGIFVARDRLGDCLGWLSNCCLVSTVSTQNNPIVILKYVH